MPPTAMHSILSKKENVHDDPLYCCVWTKTNVTDDPKATKKDFIVTGGLDSLVKVWSLDNNKLELYHTLRGHEMAVVSVAVSPDGHTLATTSMDGVLIIWDLLSGNKVHEIETSAADVWQVTFSPDGTQIVSGSHTGKLMVYGVEKGVLDRIFDTRGKFQMSVDWSADGKYLASGSEDGAICIFDVSQGKLLHTIEAHSLPVRKVAFSPNSRLFVSASDDGSVKIHNVASASLQSKLDLKSWVVSASFSPDGTRVACAAVDGKVTVAAVDGMKVLHTFQEHTDRVWGIQFNAESNKLLSVSSDKSVNIYECPIPQKNAKN